MSTFLDAMRAKWAEYGNVESPALRHAWNQMQATLDYQSGPDALDVWPVIPCELGSGKTTAAKVWCAVKPLDENHPGVLIVVRTKDQAAFGRSLTIPTASRKVSCRPAVLSSAIHPAGGTT